MFKRPLTPGSLGVSAGSSQSILPTSMNDISQDDLSSLRSFRSAGSGNSSRSKAYGSRDDRFADYRSNLRMPIMIKRFFKPPTLDFETAMWEMFYLIVQPKRVYRSLYYHKQTKNRWARDDPSFMILLAVLLTVSAIAWGLAYSPGFLSIINLILYMVFMDFFVVGVLIATMGWFLANKILKRKASFGESTIGSAPESDLEWAYCFDVHCNSFLGIWLSLYLIQFIMLPVLRMNNWFALFLGNTLYFVSISYYFVITFYGYNALPFLERTQLILFPIGILTVLYIVSLFGFNAAKFMTEFYFR